MSLLSVLRPANPPEPKDARIVSFGTMDSRPQYAVTAIERGKQAQRKHWKDHSRAQKKP